MTAMVDAMAFLVIIMIAMSVTIGYISPSEDGGSAGELLDIISEVEVRVSDMTDLEDDSVVRRTDMVAYDSVDCATGSMEYVADVLESYTRGTMYRLVIGFGDEEKVLGGLTEGGSSGAYREMFVTTGGTIRMELVLGS